MSITSYLYSKMTGYAASYFSIAIDQGNSERPGSGNEPAFLRSVDGGHLEASIISETRGADMHQLKHVGTIDAQPITIETGMASSPELLKWIQQTWQKKSGPRSGRIEHGAPERLSIRNKFSQEFYDAYLTEVTFPALAASADAESTYLKAVIQPGRVKMIPGDDSPMEVNTDYSQMDWIKTTFDFAIGATELPLKKIDSFTVKQNVTKLYTGRGRHPELVPAGLEISNLTIYCNVAEGQFLHDWYDRRLENEQGMNEVQADQPGSLVYKTHKGEPLFEIKFRNVGIYSLSVEKSVAGSTDIKQFKAGLYVEGLELNLIAGGFG
jgi:hypothetical protein